MIVYLFSVGYAPVAAAARAALKVESAIDKARLIYCYNSCSWAGLGLYGGKYET